MRRAAKVLTLAIFLGDGLSHMALGAAPSYDCRKARRPAEFAVCGSAHLSELDNVVAAGYNYIKAIRGSQFADSIAGSFLFERYRCGLNESCIEAAYFEEIRAFQVVGAPVVRPGPSTPEAGIPAQTPPYPGLAIAPAQPTPARAAMNIPLLEQNGVFEVPVSINDQITLRFVVDSGAGDVSIPTDVVSTLVRTGTLTNADFLGSQTYILADGSKVPSERFVIRSLRVGDTVLQNVTGSVAPIAGSLLLGQSFLSRFGSWSVDNNRHVLILNPKGDTLQPQEIRKGQVAVVDAFYAALSAGNGELAANFIVPEKRNGPFSPSAITAFYGGLAERLRVTSTEQIDANTFLVQYVFRGQNLNCDGKSIVSTVGRDGADYISGIKALNGC